MKVLQQETPPHSEFNSWILCHGLDAEVEAGTSVFLGHSHGSPAVTEWTMSAVSVDKPPCHTSALGYKGTGLCLSLYFWSWMSLLCLFLGPWCSGWRKGIREGHKWLSTLPCLPLPLPILTDRAELWNQKTQCFSHLPSPSAYPGHALQPWDCSAIKYWLCICSRNDFW